MKKVIIIILFIFFIFIFGCFNGGDVNNVSIDYGKSEIYSQQDMDSAIEVIKKEFATWDGCDLNEISYLGDDIAKDSIDYCNQLKQDAAFDECIVFESSFHSPKNGGDAWEPDEENTGFSWYLARKENGAWTLLTWGYG